MALIQIRVSCDRSFRDCANDCFGCKNAKVVEVKSLSGVRNQGNEVSRIRVCSRCKRPILRDERWNMMGGSPQHMNCKEPVVRSVGHEREKKEPNC